MSLAVLTTESPRPCSQSGSVRIAGKTNWAAALKLNRTDPGLGLSFEDTDFVRNDGKDAWDTLDNIAALGLTLENDEDEITHSTGLPTFSLDDLENDGVEPEPLGSSSPIAGPFHKWMKNLHKRAHRSTTQHNYSRFESFPEYSETPMGNDATSLNKHRKSSSGSSFGFVAAVRSASVSLASASVITRPRRHTGRSSLQGRSDISSRRSTSGQRYSEDSIGFERTVSHDPGVTERLLQRRRILEEIINTEESYIGDVKFLMNVYVTILASLPSPQWGLRSSINRNLTDIVELHEEILGELHRVVPNSEYTQPERIPVTPNPPAAKKHHRWRSLDSVPEDRGETSWLQHIPSVIAEPAIAAKVAHIFGKRMNRFFIYEEYGAKYELMIKDVAATHRELPQWETYQKGLEALAASLGAVNYHLDHHRKSLTIGDLLVKPIQRICRYPLLFAELLKYTPVCDCPSSHMDIDKVLIRLREATAGINRATDDPRLKDRMERTWLIQDRLIFPNQKMDPASRSVIRSFGQVRLCGALHVCWQTKDGVDGTYMVAILYRDCLCLASASGAEPVYTIQACISLADIKIETIDNGRGLQCHTAPFSWKLVFECDHQLYEIIMTACNAKEEEQWRHHILHYTPTEPYGLSEPIFYSSIFLNIKSLGTIFGKPGTIARRLSIHRATTVGPKSPLYQVILKNTCTVRDTTSVASTTQINRSQSLLTTNSRIPVLAPPRADRARVEALLSDVWSRKVLPFPGIASRSRSEHIVRNSASTVMRKLSVASITSTFAKRSISTTSVARLNEDELPHINGLVHLNHDNITVGSIRTDTSDADVKSRLPIIRDETELASSISPSITSTTGTRRQSGAAKKDDPLKLDLEWIGERGTSTPTPTPTSRLSPLNSVRRKRQTSFSARSSPSSTEDDENIYHGLGMKHRLHETLTNVRPSSKWAKVGGINRGLMASSIRSFFR
ncbi:Dbl homology domain-containing protein [Annulohypoxylon maeteangense]|uniref:Dbl homology domain-containing protein n=1 Tax=Annulohypoxylon maeteangense TaxID=1927788 RepID=UPI002007E89B|nr:Dbl homology domain-containing protein [Annulohypoxylon maeteangense]KAI0890048.1 Dbl homology domain-containing protein [Annulohypoxylon maeteangense]